jgi:hypothetical protein
MFGMYEEAEEPASSGPAPVCGFEMTREARCLIDINDKLQALPVFSESHGAPTMEQPPQVAVIGLQTSGKSSVLRRSVPYRVQPMHAWTC